MTAFLFNSFVNGIVLYAILWFLVLFMVLPFGIRTMEESGETRETGHASSAPANPRILLKLLITSILSAILWVIAFYLLENDVLGFRSYIRGSGY